MIDFFSFQDRYIIGSTIFLYLIAMWHAGSETLVTDDDLLSTLDQYAFYGFCGLFGLIQIIFTLIVVLSLRPFILDYIYIVKPFSCFNIRIAYI